MAQKNLFLFFLLWPFAVILSQVSLRGEVTDSIGVPMNSVQIYALVLPDSVIIARQWSDELGKFELKLPSAGQFKLVFQRFAYAAQVVDYNIVEDDKSPIGGLKIELQELPVSIPEVIVNAQKPIFRTKDTLHLLVETFLKGDERVVEDILKQLPGIEVGADGGIRVRGKAVSKVLIEGDNLFDGQYNLLTRNLNADLIEEVQVLFRYSDNPLLKDIQNAESTALNIRLKDTVKNAWFGQSEFGLGIPELYAVRPNVIQVNKSTKMYFLGNLNNSGIPAIADLPDLNAQLFSEAESYIGDRENLESVHASGFRNFRTVGNRSSFNRALLGAGSAVLNPKPNLKIGVQTHLAQDISQLRFTEKERVDIRELNFINSETRNTNFASNQGRYRLNIQYRPKGQQLEWVTSAAQFMWGREDDLRFNTAILDQQLKENSLALDNRLSYTLRLGNMDALLLTSRKKKEQSTFRTVIDTAVWATANSGNNTLHPSQEVVQHSNFSGTELTWIAKRDSWNWKVFSAFSNRKSHLSTQNAQWGADLEQFIKTDENLNQIDSEVFRLLTGFSVRYSKPKWTFRSGFSLSSLKNRITGNQSASFKTHLWIPLVGADWNPNRSNTLFLKYSFDVIETKLLDWYTGWILTGYRNFTSGAGWINPYRAHNWIFGYTLGNWGDAFQLNTSLYYQREPRYLGMDTEISPQFVISQPREFLNRTNFALNIQADQYVKALSGNLKARLEINQNQFTSVINTRGIPIRTQWMQFGPEWKTLFNGKVNFHGGYSWNFSSTLATRLSRLPSQRGFLDADLNLGSQWHVGFNTEMHRFGSEIGMNTYVFSDLSAALKTKSGRPVYRLNVNNIWNKKAIETRSLTNSGYTVSGIPLRPRTVLVSAEFKL